jgi:outer membrane protein assembly factor BamC
VQGGVVSASAMQQNAAAAPAANAVRTDANVAVAKAGDVSLERSGDQRWLLTSLTPEQLWPQLRAFWQERGLVVKEDQPQVGVMETDWAENRSKIPADGLRKYLGTFLDGLYSSGERDMYRTRVERTAKGTEIYISHRGMQEVPTTRTKDDFRWAARPSDPQLEAEMLSRLMLKLGGKEEAAAAVVANAPATPVAPPPTATAPSETRDLSKVPTSLQVADGFDRAWRRVGQSLDRNGFTIEDRDRVQGLYFLRYADPTKAGKEEPNFFAKLFGAKVDTTAGRYRVSVKSVGEVSTVQVLDDKGNVQSDDIAKRIIGMMMDDLK